MSAIEEYDVVVVGLGPTGLTAAALLGQLKHRVAVIEKHPSMFGLPRAGHVDHEIVRTLQDLGVLPGESVEDFTRPEKAWTLLAGVGITSDDVEIRRQLVYHFEAKVAESWRDGRILLAGDAAHTMPPFMGQGACSGMRDSANLAWKLDLILRGISSDAILDSYQVEREPHTRTWIDLSILSGEVSCTLDPEAAAKRDAALLSGTAPPMPAFPHLTSGALHKDAQGAAIAPAGELFLQRQVVAGARRGLFDDVVGRGFLLIGRDGDPRIGLSEADTRFLSDIGTTAAWIASAGQSTATAFEDSTGEYVRLFDQAGASP